MKTWTKHKLSERQCKVLSQIVNNRLRNVFRPTLDKLEREGLIEKSDSVWPDRRPHGDFFIYTPTTLGVLALEAARREGW